MKQERIDAIVHELQTAMPGNATSWLIQQICLMLFYVESAVEAVAYIGERGQGIFLLKMTGTSSWMPAGLPSEAIDEGINYLVGQVFTETESVSDDTEDDLREYLVTSMQTSSRGYELRTALALAPNEVDPFEQLMARLLADETAN